MRPGPPLILGLLRWSQQLLSKDAVWGLFHSSSTVRHLGTHPRRVGEPHLNSTHLNSPKDDAVPAPAILLTAWSPGRPGLCLRGDNTAYPIPPGQANVPAYPRDSSTWLSGQKHPIFKLMLLPSLQRGNQPSK